MSENEAYDAGFIAGQAVFKDPHGNYRCPWGQARDDLRRSWQRGFWEATAVELRALAAEERAA